MARLVSVMQHLQANLHQASAVRCFLRVFDALGYGALLIGDAKKVLGFNGQVEQHLGAGLLVRSDRLVASDGASDRALQGIVSDHLSGVGQPREALGLHRKDARPLILRFVSLAETVQAAFEGARLVVIVADPEYCPEPTQELLLQAFGLTRREAAVATQLMCGCSLQEIAETTGTGVGTVRAQTKAVLAKTGTKRQAELVGLLTRFALISGKAH